MGLTLIQGSESVLADRAIANLVNLVNRSKKDKNATLTTLDASEIELGAITDALAPSLFGEDRVIVIREIQELAAELQEEITEYLANPEDSVELILWHKGGVKGKGLLDKLKKLKPQLIAAEAIKKEGEKAQFVHDEFSRMSRKVSIEAVQALVDALGSDLRELAGACSQLGADVQAGKIIELADVAKFHQGRVETTGFEVADAVVEGRADLALIALSQAIATGTDPVLIVSALASAFRAMAKVSTASPGMKSFELASSLGLPPWQIDKARKQIQGWNPKSLGAAVIALAEADAGIKGAAADPHWALESAILKICDERKGRSSLSSGKSR